MLNLYDCVLLSLLVNITVYNSPALLNIIGNTWSLHIFVYGCAFHNNATWDLVNPALSLIRHGRGRSLIKADVFLGGVHLKKFHAHIYVGDCLLFCFLGV